MNVKQIVQDAIEAGDEGLTILGGEPLQQPQATLALILEARQHDLGIFLYTGYDFDELEGDALRCYEASDIVVAGRYIESERNTDLRWRGSSNQTVEFRTDRYKEFEFIEGNDVQITIGEDGSLTILGYPDEALLNDLLDSELSVDARGRIGPSSDLLPSDHKTMLFCKIVDFSISLRRNFSLEARKEASRALATIFESHLNTSHAT